MVTELEQLDIITQADAAWEAGRFALAFGFYQQLMRTAPAATLSESMLRRMKQYTEGTLCAERACDALRYDQDVRNAKRWVAEARQALPGYGRIEPIGKEVARWEGRFQQLELALATSNWNVVASAAGEIAEAFPQNQLAREARSLLDHHAQMKLAIHALTQAHAGLNELFTKANVTARQREFETTAIEITLQHLPHHAGPVIDALNHTAQCAATRGTPSLIASDYARVVQPQHDEAKRLHDELKHLLLELCVLLAETLMLGGAFEDARRVAIRPASPQPGSKYSGIKPLFEAYRCELPLAPPDVAKRHRDRLLALDALNADQEPPTAEPGATESVTLDAPVSQTRLPLHTAIHQHATELESRVGALHATIEHLKTQRRWSEAANLAEAAAKLLPRLFAERAARLQARQQYAIQQHMRLQAATQQGNFKEVQRLLSQPDTRKLLSANDWNNYQRAMKARAEAQHQKALALGTLVGVLVLLGIIAVVYQLRVTGVL